MIIIIITLFLSWCAHELCVEAGIVELFWGILLFTKQESIHYQIHHYISLHIFFGHFLEISERVRVARASKKNMHLHSYNKKNPLV